MVRTRETMQWAAAVWTEMPCWGQRITVTQITTSYNQGRIPSEHTTSRTFEVDGRQQQNRNRCQSCQVRTGNWSDEVQKVGSDLWQTTWKCGPILLCIGGSGCWWWCNGVEDIFSAHLGSLSTNCASFKHRSVLEYCCWPYLSLHDHSRSIFRWILPAGERTVSWGSHHLKLVSWTSEQADWKFFYIKLLIHNIQMHLWHVLSSLFIIISTHFHILLHL